ncbi:MAG: hypothetical protein IPP73_01245 [Chitinophagaceae bacterium]|nr:hypothetical protein [Chitinophagaceae bacterium]
MIWNPVKPASVYNMRNTFPIFFLVFLLTSSCKPGNQKKPFARHKTPFSYFELSYYSGWTGSFSFSVDADTMARFSKRPDSVYYGRLPDSLFDQVQTLADSVLGSRENRKDSLNCDDCSILAVMVKNETDSIMHMYAHPYPEKWERFMSACRDWQKDSRLPIRYEFWFAETAAAIIPMPPSINKRERNDN